MLTFYDGPAGLGVAAFTILCAALVHVVVVRISQYQLTPHYHLVEGVLAHDLSLCIPQKLRLGCITPGKSRVWLGV